MVDLIQDIFDAWSRGRGALLYGPAGTGKTRLLSQLFQELQQSETDDEGLVLDPDDAEQPLGQPRRPLPIPGPVKVIWTTFHQSYTYEDFILGLRPAPGEAGALLSLQPRLGLLMDAVYELTRGKHYNSVVIFIDEVNRGNAARIFGEFLTFLDFDYRASLRDGTDNPQKLPLPLRQLDLDGDETQDLARAEQGLVKLPWPAYFPRHIYLVGTMNSVDRAAIPLDSALARRFERVELRAHLEVLAREFELDMSTVETRALEVRQGDGNEWTSLSAYETALLLLDRLNLFLAAELGSEFELGHALLLPIRASDDAARWQRLAKAWDDVVYPQLEDRFAGRPEQLIELLKVEQPPPGIYAWSLRRGLGGLSHGRALAPVRLGTLNTEQQTRSLQWLCL